jgi:peptidoglycan/xylan/chitin deacetylase (PgdA/CDA1 family)
MLFRPIKLFLSLSVFLHDRVFDRLRKLFGCSVPGGCVFLNYHSINARTRKRFAAQMELLTNWARPLPALRSQELEDGLHYVAVTFDDAFRCFAADALPILTHFRIPVILFVPSGYLGRKSAWFDYGGENPVGEEVVSAEELLEIARRGGVEIGSHTVTHRNLVQLDEGAARAELRDSKALLESILGRNIFSVSFPYGSFGDRELKLAREEGYSFCFSVAPHSVASEIREGLIGRVSVQPSDWNLEFRLKLMGAYRWLPWASGWKHKIRKFATDWLPTRRVRTHG